MTAEIRHLVKLLLSEDLDTNHMVIVKSKLREALGSRTSTIKVILKDGKTEMVIWPKS